MLDVYWTYIECISILLDWSFFQILFRLFPMVRTKFYFSLYIKLFFKIIRGMHWCFWWKKLYKNQNLLGKDFNRYDMVSIIVSIRNISLKNVFRLIQLAAFSQPFPASIRRRFNVVTKLLTSKQRRINIKTAPWPCWVKVPGFWLFLDLLKSLLEDIVLHKRTWVAALLGIPPFSGPGL